MHATLLKITVGFFMNDLWKSCMEQLSFYLPESDINVWICPLQARQNQNSLSLFAPNRYVLDWVKKNALSTISNYVKTKRPKGFRLLLEVGSAPNESNNINKENQSFIKKPGVDERRTWGRLNAEYNFGNFVEGKSNQMARAAAMQAAANPGNAYNPLFLYGGTGLGKTHLMHAVGNEILRRHESACVAYLHSEQFVAQMVHAIRHNSLDLFKKRYRSVNTLLVDDVQMFVNKSQTQEEFFHTFNWLFERKQQIVLSCDRYPREIDGLQERLKSRFGCGLTQSIEPPEFETRVAILAAKAAQSGHELPDDVSFFIAKAARSNVRELEGALKRVIATADFTNTPPSMDIARVALQDLIKTNERLINVANIQKTVCEFYNLPNHELISNRRARFIVRPRQIAMLLAKELTSQSMPEIGRVFGGRDHTTVLHACRKIKQLKKENKQLQDDYQKLVRILNS